MLPSSPISSNKTTSTERELSRESDWFHTPVAELGREHRFDVLRFDRIDARRAQRLGAEGVTKRVVSSSKLW